MAVTAQDAARARWRSVVPQSEYSINNAAYIGGRVVLDYTRDARSLVRLFNVDGTAAGEVQRPGLGTAAGFQGSGTDPETFFSYSDYLSPARILRLHAGRKPLSEFRTPKVPADFSPYVTEQVFYASKDGTRVPMFITRRKDAPRDGNQPVMLYGYGGGDNPLSPSFSPSIQAWLEMGGIYAVANLRGGGEYGEEWHQAGTKLRKQNVFDDFIAAAEYLIREKITSTPKLAIEGGSNGGLLAGACITQRPDLFGAALPAVGVMDMLRFHRFTIGWAWVSDYGSPENPEEFKALYAYSPYHNIKKGVQYPATLVTTADHDDRVVPAHSFKFI